MDKVPLQYHKYTKLFNERFETEVLQYSKQDYEIFLMEKKILRFYKIYNFNETELKELCVYL